MSGSKEQVKMFQTPTPMDMVSSGHTVHIMDHIYIFSWNDNFNFFYKQIYIYILSSQFTADGSFSFFAS